MQACTRVWGLSAHSLGWIYGCFGWTVDPAQELRFRNSWIICPGMYGWFMFIYLHEGSGHIKVRKLFDKYAHPMEHLGISWKHVMMFSLSGLILGFGGPNCWLRVLPCHILKYSRCIDIFVVKSLISKIFPMPLERTSLCQRCSFVLSECSKVWYDSTYP